MLAELKLTKLDLPDFLVRNFGVVRTQDKGIIPIQLFDWQKEFLQLRREHNKVIILKSRDVGSSTIAVLEFTSKVVLFGGDF